MVFGVWILDFVPQLLLGLVCFFWIILIVTLELLALSESFLQELH